MGFSSHKGGDSILRYQTGLRHRYWCDECQIGFDDYHENKDHQDEHAEDEKENTNGKEEKSEKKEA